MRDTKEMLRDLLELDESALDASAGKVLAALAARPLLAPGRPCLQRLADGRTSFVVQFASPTGDAWRHAWIWIDERGVPTIEFAAWHTHADLFDDDGDVGLDQMLQLLERIITGRVLLMERPQLDSGLPYWVLDLDDEDEVLDLLTEPRGSGRMKLFSWSGAHDVELEELRSRFE